MTELAEGTEVEMAVRQCSAQDWRAMIRLRMSRPTHAGSRVSTFTSSPLSELPTRYQNAPHLAVGCWADGVLVAYICAFAGHDFWVLDLTVSSAGPKYLQPCLEQLLQEFEARGITQFWYAFPEKWSRSYRSLWRDGAPSLRKYTIEDVEVLPANKIPTNPFIWQNVLHERVVPVPLLLRRSYVKETT